jgi:endonuclease-3
VKQLFHVKQFRGLTVAHQETDEGRTKRVREILKRLHKQYPEAATALHFRTPLEMLAATILSAQCLDKTVNEVTPALFAKYPTAAAYAQADRGELEALIHRTGFFRNKAKSLMGMGQALVELYGGEVPGTMAEMVRLPGVARKTANVVLGSAFGRAEGVVVDTHVSRISQRLGLTVEKTPEKIEKDLMALLPKKEWIFFGEAIILHGRATCVARKPRCEVCVLEEVCPRVGVG